MGQKNLSTAGSITKKIERLVADDENKMLREQSGSSSDNLYRNLLQTVLSRSFLWPERDKANRDTHSLARALP